MRDIVLPLDKMPHITLCPSVFNLQPISLRALDTYIGPCIRRHAIDADAVSYREKAGNRKLIYACMGSQINVYPQKVRQFFKAVIDCMSKPEMNSFYLVLSAGGSNLIQDNPSLPPNMDVVKWVSQISLLQVADLAVIHGGLGSVKECIYQGIPMIIIPMVRDQFDNADRVVKHGLGEQLNIEALSPEKLCALLLKIAASGAVKERVSAMQQVFRTEEDKKSEIPFLANLLGTPVV
jgi:MGT family glycosyltransferase